MSLGYAAKYGRGFFPPRYFPDRATILEPGKTVGSQGGQKLTYTEAYTNVPVRVYKAQSRPDELQVGGKNTNKNRFNVAMAPEQVISTQARIVVTSLSNRTFDVQGLNDGSDAITKVAETIEINRP